MNRWHRSHPLLWLALAGALAMGLQEWLALLRCRLRDRRQRSLPGARGAHAGHAGRGA